MLSDAFYRLVICAFVLELLIFSSVSTNLSLFRKVHFQKFFVMKQLCVNFVFKEKKKSDIYGKFSYVYGKISKAKVKKIYFCHFHC